MSINSVEWSSEISLTDTFPRTKQAKSFEFMVDTGTEIMALYLESMSVHGCQSLIAYS